ncbi:MAG: polyprenyl synthetase [Deltaproteobacteria bacterium RIFCSPLOWO2_12_FULL_60_19]|nr:MAG: polyprenyl synthetase [Deltaproteobacteria bacterium RIFCSPLOWO2_12_FULL_60_19]
MPKLDIEAYLSERKALIDRSLERYLKQSEQRPRTIVKAMRYGVLSGGKRLRPILTLASGELFGAERKQLLLFACALELIHAYSLVHDDLPALDNDDFRRGEPATHKLFGEGIALLAGDALLTEAFQLMSRPEAVRSLKPGLVLELIYDISRAAGADGLVGGQAVDLEAEDKQADTAAVEHIHARKTGALICVCAKVGAKIGGATRQELRRVERYGGYLGLAFQIADDIMDAAGHGGEGRAGSEKKKATYPSVAGLGAARKRARELLDRCLKELDPFGKDADPLRAIARTIVERAL